MHRMKQHYHLLFPYCVLILLSGCALADPFIEESDWKEVEEKWGKAGGEDISWEKETREVCMKSHDLKLCIDQAEKLRAVYNKKSIEISKRSGYHHNALIVLGSAGAALGAYRDSADAVTGVGILGSASYAFNKLIPWERNLAVYQEGQKSLSKVIRNASMAVNNMRAIEHGKVKDDMQKFLDAKKAIYTKQAAETEKDAETEADAEKAAEAKEVAKAKKETYKKHVQGLEQVDLSCLQGKQSVDENVLQILDEMIEIEKKHNEYDKKKFEEIHKACSEGTSFFGTKTAQLIERKKQIEERLGVLQGQIKQVSEGDPNLSRSLFDIYQAQSAELSKVESQYESIRGVTERIEEAVSGIADLKSGTRDKVSIWLGLALLEIRYAVEGVLSEVNAMEASENPADSAKKIRGNVRGFTDIFQTPKSEPDAPNGASSSAQ